MMTFERRSIEQGSVLRCRHCGEHELDHEWRCSFCRRKLAVEKHEYGHSPLLCKRCRSSDGPQEQRYAGGDLVCPPRHIICPECTSKLSAPGWIFQNARGGFECSCCDARFLFKREHPNGYGGPEGPLGWFERLRLRLSRWLAPR